MTRGKYSAKKRKRKKKKQKREVRSHMFLGGFKFPECPISWVPEWLWKSGNILYHSDKSDIPFFSGGLADQPYQLYRLSRIIGSESAKIDEEKRDKNNK